MTPPVPARNSPAGRAYNDLRNLARRNHRDPAEYFTLYALEGFLVRLATSGHAEDFVLKGGLLMAAFAARRPTRDVDLAALGLGNDVTDVERRIRSVIGQHLDDGLVFETDSVSGDEIRDDAAYAGVRVSIVAWLASARIALHVDVNFGDPIWPGPAEVELPLLLGGGMALRGYPDHMVLAEKIVTAIDRGDLNTRWRDFVDIAAIIHERPILFGDLRRGLEVVANYRGVELRPLSPLLARMPEMAQQKWAMWRRKQRLSDATPERFADLLTECIAFADPVLGSTRRVGMWMPAAQSWSVPE